MIIGSTFAAITLVALWVAAWLHWVFDGEIRHFLFAKIFPKKWNSGRDPSEILLFSSEEFEIFLGAECAAPAFLRGLLGCPGCLSAHLSVPATLMVSAAFLPWQPLVANPLNPILILVILCCLPFIWACGAWAGHRLHNYL